MVTPRELDLFSGAAICRAIADRLLADVQAAVEEGMDPASIASFGPSLLFHDRIPTGLFPFDLATGGGFPRGRASVIYGPESSNKTNMALRAIANQVDDLGAEAELPCVGRLDEARARHVGFPAERAIDHGRM